MDLRHFALYPSVVFLGVDVKVAVWPQAAMYAIGPDPLAAAGVDGVRGVAGGFAVFGEADPGVVHGFTLMLEA